MATMNVSIPEELKAFVESQVSSEAYSTSSEYIRELIRRDRQRIHLRGLLLEGLTDETSEPVNDEWWNARRSRLHPTKK